MLLRHRLVVPAIFSALAVLAGCGGSNGTTNPVPPPSGSFSNSSLNGTYVFSVSGIDSSGAPYALVGTFTANGSGGVSGGTLDINDADLSSPAPNQAITGGNYKVNVDGRGTATLGTSVLGNVTLAFVLQDGSHGLLTEFDSNATGSGTLDLQSAGVSPAGTYAFNFSGYDYSSGSANLFETIGNFTVGSAGAVTTGLEDYNDGSFAVANQALSGSVVLGPSSTPSTVLASSGFGTLTFDVFAIDASHLKFIEMDPTANLVGDAYSQTSTTLPTGTLAFTMEGSYPGASTISAAGGFIVTDGNGNVTNASTVDGNNGGTVSPTLGFSGTYTAAGTGRYTLSLSSFTAGTSYAAYPFNGGVFLLEIDDAGVMSGAAFAQTQIAFNASQGYGLNFTGGNLNDGVQVDDIAEFTANSSGTTVTGIIDENFQPGGTVNSSLTLSGTYTVPDSNGRGSIAATAGNSTNSTLNGGFGINFYSVDGTTFPFVETDANGQITTGTFFQQNPSASSAAAATAKNHMFVVRPLPRAHANWKKQK